MRPLFLLLVLALTTVPLHAQPNLAGEWKGAAKGSDGTDYNLILTVTPHPGAASTATFAIEDVTDTPVAVTGLALTGSTIRFAAPALKGHFRGTLNPDHTSMQGQWTDADGTVPLDLQHLPPHKVSFVTVAPNVRLEVLDWGGAGRPLILLAGLGDTAHVFDAFAPQLAAHFHVYGITRRGFGASSHPDPSRPANYPADRLGDDVLAVLNALHLQMPILAGHSIAGEELSSVGSRHPDRVAGLIYLDAAYGYAHYNPDLGDYSIDLIDLHNQLDRLLPGFDSPNEASTLKQLQTDLPRFQRDVQRRLELSAAMPTPDDAKPSQALPDQPQPPSPSLAILLGQQKYSALPLPVLAIYALPHRFHDQYPGDPKAEAAAEAYDLKHGSAIADAFARDIPTAKVIRIPHADHYIFQSNQAEVLREITTFAATLPQ